MAITTQEKGLLQQLKFKDLELERKDKNINELKFGLMVASQREPNMESPEYRDKKINEKYKRINNPTTEGQKLEKKGGYIDTGELDSGGKPLMIQGMPPEINPEEHKRLQKQKKIRGIAEEGATEGERQAGRGKLKDQTQLPNFLKTIINSKPNPADLLKILQFLPALTGGGLGQMAGPNYGADKRKYGASDAILNPHGDFKKPTLEMLIKHAANYPKA